MDAGGDLVDVLVFFVVEVELRDTVRFAFDSLINQLRTKVSEECGLPSSQRVACSQHTVRLEDPNEDDLCLHQICSGAGSARC